MNQEERISALVKAGEKVKELLRSNFDDGNHAFVQMLQRVQQSNPWFTLDEQRRALQGVVHFLDEKRMHEWAGLYPGLKKNVSPKTIGLIMAGNIPLVGFHDFLCVLVSGHRLLAKCSSDDSILLPWFYKLLQETDSTFGEQVTFAEKIADIDAVIATGSNNTARYFEYYFGKYPHIIRKNRNGVGVITGDETPESLQLLGIDIFSYFGMGCRNVSKLYVPHGYVFDGLFSAIQSFAGVMQHNKYLNNHDYQSALLLMNLEKFLTNNFLIIKEGASYATPVGLLNYEYYDDMEHLVRHLAKDRELIQCIVAAKPSEPGWLPFGKSQLPGLLDYADGMDTMRFLEELRG
jgi:hypothetical protein